MEREGFSTLAVAAALRDRRKTPGAPGASAAESMAICPLGGRSAPTEGFCFASDLRRAVFLKATATGGQLPTNFEAWAFRRVFRDFR
jgi:hypothetical protein